ncbi:MAG: hypothetical protein HZC36_13110 [Armatimonadetes bacterium]|nr:hypothetical protein [Armatimonadota bacterium]
MKRPLQSLLTLFVLLCALPAIAQEPPAREMMLGKKIFYALGPEIRAEIKLTPAQSQKIVDCFEGALTIEGDRIMVTMHGGEDMAGMEKAAMKVLDAAQIKRLTECWIQVLGGIAVADDEIAKQLKLTDKQRKDVERALEVGADEMHGVFSSGAHDESTQKAAKAVQVATGKKIEKLLTDEQRAAFEKMKGEPMKKKDKKDGA